MTTFNISGVANFGFSPPQPDPNNPYYQIDLKYTGVNPGTFGTGSNIPLLKITSKGFITNASVSTGISTPPFVSDFTIQGLNNPTNPLKTNLENYTPDRDDVSTGSVFLGNYAFDLYDPADVKLDSAVSSVSIGSKSNSVNDNNKYNVAIGQQAMEDAEGYNAVAIGSSALDGYTGINSIQIGKSTDLANNVGSNNITVGNYNSNPNGKENVIIGNRVISINQSTATKVIGIGHNVNLQAKTDDYGISIISIPNMSGSNDNLKVSNNDSVLIINSNGSSSTVKVNMASDANVLITNFKDMDFFGNVSGDFVLKTTTIIGTNNSLRYANYSKEIYACTQIGVRASLNFESDSKDTVINDCVAIGNNSVAASRSVSIGNNAGRFDTSAKMTIFRPWAIGQDTGGVLGIQGNTNLYPQATNLGVFSEHVYSPFMSVPVQGSISGGRAFILNDDGRIYSCGGSSDVLYPFDTQYDGIASTELQSSKDYIQVGWSENNRSTYIDSNYAYLLALKNDKSVWITGNGYYATDKRATFSLLDSGPYDKVSLSRGIGLSTTVLAIKTDGSLNVATTWNKYGTLGNGTTSEAFTALSMQPVSLSGTFTKIAAGELHMMALRSDGKLYVWGDNQFGQLGTSDNKMYTTPILISGFPLGNGKFDTSPVIDISANSRYSVVVTQNNNAFLAGQLGGFSQNNVSIPNFNTNSYVLISKNSDINACYAVENSNIALRKTTGGYYGFGDGNFTFFLGDEAFGQSKNTRTTPFSLINLSRLNEREAIFANGYPGPAGLVIAKYDYANYTSNRICIATKGPSIPNTINIGDNIGNNDGSGVENNATTGSASALPALPAGFLRTEINQTKYKLPLFNV